MAQEVLVQVKQAEQHAADAVREAKERADEIIKEAEREIRAGFEELEEQSRENLEAVRDESYAQSKKNTAIYKEETDKLTNELAEKLAERQQGAVDFAIAALME